MRYFNLGNTEIASSLFEEISERDFTVAEEQYRNKFWGSVDHDRKKKNDQVSMEDKGEIHAIYEAENGTSFHFITIEDRSLTIICLASDLENGEYEKFLESIEESKRRQAVMYSAMISNSAPIRRRSG